MLLLTQAPPLRKDYYDILARWSKDARLMIMRYYNKAQQLKKTNHVFRYSQGSGLAPPEMQWLYIRRLQSRSCIKYCGSNCFVSFHGRGEQGKDALACVPKVSQGCETQKHTQTLPYEMIITIFLQDEVKTLVLWLWDITIKRNNSKKQTTFSVIRRGAGLPLPKCNDYTFAVCKAEAALNTAVQIVSFLFTGGASCIVW